MKLAFLFSEKDLLSLSVAILLEVHVGKVDGLLNKRKNKVYFSMTKNLPILLPPETSFSSGNVQSE
jgi:hypothetical protein